MSTTAGTQQLEDYTIPKAGMLAIVRNRRGVVAAVDEFSADEKGSFHLVTVEYTDNDGPSEEDILWEREPRARVIEPRALPDVQNDPPMKGHQFKALNNATRWSAVTPYLHPDGSGEVADTPIASPFYGAVQSEDFQLVPLIKAMRMPRVSLLLADDVGLGKTIEAGMILRELLLRRRVRRVLILTPAALREQWTEEMDDKFSLSFDVVDRKSTQDLKKRMGLDANPWRTFPRIVASYHYLRQPHVLEEFRAATRKDGEKTDAKLPWDLLIVDEAHNLMPSSYGEDSQLAEMLRDITPWFEHKLFLTATPHNGYTRSFTGLLESLDPMRFEQKGKLDDKDEERIDEAVVRRLKRDINELDRQRDRTRRFAERIPKPRKIDFGAGEQKLSEAFKAFRTAVNNAPGRGAGADRMVANFAIQILNKRLLSTPFAFADSWLRFTEGLRRDEAADAREVKAAKEAAEQDHDDDREKETREGHAARTTGAWMQAIADEVRDEIEAVTEALGALGISPDDADFSGEDIHPSLPEPNEDTRYDELRTIVEERLRDDGEWVDDERLIIFTEYKTTLDYLVRRLTDDFDDPDGRRIRHLFGGMSQDERRDVKHAFNDPEHPVRILVGTDAASEGLNLQETARLLLHFDVPWNPSRLDQRNGRLDRHGQARDVEIFHFDSDNDADQEFMARVVRKVEEIREDLGSMGEVFDSAFEARMLDGQDPEKTIRAVDAAAEKRKGKTREAHTGSHEELLEETGRVEDFRDHIGLTAERLKETLDVALSLGASYPQLEGPDDEGRYKFTHGQVPDDWRGVVEEELFVDPESAGGSRRVTGALPRLVFNPDALVDDSQGRPVFRHPTDSVLMHLGHPVFEHALARFAQARFPTGTNDAQRWIASRGPVPDGADALIVLFIEELAVNALREPFHHWMRTVRFPVDGSQLGDPLPYQPPSELETGEATQDAVSEVRPMWQALAPQLGDWLEARRDELSDTLRERLDQQRETALEREKKRYEQRLGEVSGRLQDGSTDKLRREIEELEREYSQEMFLSQMRKLSKAKEGLQAELRRHRQKYERLLDHIKKERERMIEEVVPRRHELAGEVQVFPVTVEIRLPQ